MAWPGSCSSAGFATVGALLVWKRPGNPIGWLLSATGLSYAAAGFGILLSHFPAARAFVNWSGWIWLFGVGLTVFVLLLFPTGHLPSRRWRPVAWAAAAGLAAWVLGNAFAPRIITDDTPTPNPIGVAAPAGNVFLVLAIGGLLLIVGTGAGRHRLRGVPVPAGRDGRARAAEVAGVRGRADRGGPAGRAGRRAIHESGQRVQQPAERR